MTTPSERPDVSPESLADATPEEVARVLRLRAADRRTSGVYPPDLEAQMQTWTDSVMRWSGVSSADVVGPVEDRVVALETAFGHALSLVARIERLEAAERSRRFEPWYSRDAFERRFRGERSDVLRAVAEYADVFSSVVGPVVDIGCGRGELLEVLRAHTISGYGVDVDASVVQEVCDRGFDARAADAIEHLRCCVNSSLGGVAMLQVIEHLPPQGQLDVVAAAASALAPGGRILIESINPMSLYVYRHALYLDPTHTQPVHPLYLQFVLEQAGFVDVDLRWRGAVADGERLPLDGFGPHADPNIITRLNDVLYGAQDYVLVGTRAEG